MCNERTNTIKQGEDPDPDPATGVTMLLSPRIVDLILLTGSRVHGIEDRVSATRRDNMCNLLIVVSCMSHRGRKRVSCTKDITVQLRDLLKTMYKMNCVVIMGDLNCRL